MLPHCIAFSTCSTLHASSAAARLPTPCSIVVFNSSKLIVFFATKLRLKVGVCKHLRYEFHPQREMSTWGVDCPPYSNEIWSVIPRLSAMRSNCSTVGFALPQLIRFRYCLLHPNRVASSASLMFFSLMLSSNRFWFLVSLFYVIMLLCLFQVMMSLYQKSPTARSRAVRPIGYFAVLQDAEQISVPAVQSGKRSPAEQVGVSSRLKE